MEYLHKVFCERCGMNLKIQLDFQEMQESKYRKNAALQIRQEVANVLKHAKLTPETAESSKDTEGEAAQGKSSVSGSKDKDSKKSGQNKPNLLRRKRDSRTIIEEVSVRTAIRMSYTEETLREKRFH